jgi:hypothetical protein
LYAWTGGSGSAPTSLGYLTPTGLSAVVTDACNIRGAVGPGLTGANYWLQGGEYFSYANVGAGVYQKLLIRKAESGMVYFHMEYTTGNADYTFSWKLPKEYKPNKPIHFWSNAWYSANIADPSPAYVKFDNDVQSGNVPELPFQRFTMVFWGIRDKQVSISGCYMTEEVVSESITPQDMTLLFTVTH